MVGRLGVSLGGQVQGQARDRVDGRRRLWHNGLTSESGNAVFNKNETVTIMIDNGYSAATGGQDILSSRAENKERSTKNSIERAVRGVGGGWVRSINRTYDLKKMRDALREAMTTRSEEHTSELKPLMRIPYAVFCLNKQTRTPNNAQHPYTP